MDELPDEAIEDAEQRRPSHDHAPMDDEAFAEHLRVGHGLDAPAHLSRSTVDGIHDRLHHEAHAAVDPQE